MAPSPSCVPRQLEPQGSERDFDAGRDEIAIVEQGVLTNAREKVVVGVRDVELPGVVKARRETERGRDTAPDESPSGPWRNTIHVLHIGEVRQQVPVADHAVVLEPPGDDVAPGEAARERPAGLEALAERIADRALDALAADGRELRIAAEIRIAAEVRPRPVEAQPEALRAAGELVLETRHVVGPSFEDQHRLGSLEDIGEDLRGSEVEVPRVLELITLDRLPDLKRLLVGVTELA